MIDLSKDILYEDAYILVLNKPAGLVVHPDGRTKEESVTEWFVEKYPEARNVGEKLGEIERPGVVHRIDRDTSGVLVFAKNAMAYEFMRKAFHDRDIRKTYLAVVYGVPKEKEGVIFGWQGA